MEAKCGEDSWQPCSFENMTTISNVHSYSIHIPFIFHSTVHSTDFCRFFRWRKNDPSGEYLRRWLPELQKLDAKYIHEPWAMSEELMTRCFSTKIDGDPWFKTLRNGW